MEPSKALILVGILTFLITLCQGAASQCGSGCKNNGTCTDVFQGHYVCVCAKGWTGLDCTTDIDECATLGFNPCGEHSYCVNTQGGYSCSCKEGFSGVGCTTRIRKSIHLNRRLLGFPTPPPPPTTTTLNTTTASPPPLTTKVPPTPNAIKTPKPITEFHQSAGTTLAPPPVG